MSAASLSSSIAILAAPALSNCSLGGNKFGTIGSMTKKEKKDKKKRRIRSESKTSIESDSISSKDSSSCAVSNSQWYTTPSNDADNFSLASYNSIVPATPSIVDFDEVIEYFRKMVASILFIILPIPRDPVQLGVNVVPRVNSFK